MVIVRTDRIRGKRNRGGETRKVYLALGERKYLLYIPDTNIDNDLCHNSIFLSFTKRKERRSEKNFLIADVKSSRRDRAVNPQF